jgi:NhaP-type Na+/H+ or K+/H+ antiporter
MDYEPIAIIATFAFFYSVLAARFQHSKFGGAVAFMGFGLAMGPVGLGLLTINGTSSDFRAIAEITLALVLFADASQADMSVLRRSFRIPGRLILIGLPLTILLGFAFGVLLFDDLTMIEVAILAAILAPTDAALGKAVVTNKKVPAEIREALSFESGLNDGVCVPVFLTFLALATLETSHGGDSGLFLPLLVQELGIGALVGAAFAMGGAFVLRLFRKDGWATDSWVQIPVIALSIACFASAQMLHGSGFIAAFVGGLVFGAAMRRGKHELVRPAEGMSDVFALITWVVFGAAVLAPALRGITWEVILYAICSLTVVRMLPVFLSLAGTDLDTPKKLFIGWFGPRGLATGVFAVMVMDSGIAGAATIVSTAVCTILFSILAHGISSLPFVAALARKERPGDPAQSLD